MDRKYFLKALGAATIGLSLSPIASSGRSCKIIGIGGAGCNFVLDAAQSGAVLTSSEWVPEFICIDLDQEVLNCIDADNAAKFDCAPIKTLSRATLSAAGRVNRGRTAALLKRDELRALLADPELVILVTGLGGGTGSGVTPIATKLAREAGASTMIAAVTPFELEGKARNRTADIAFAHLKREADLVVRFSNQELMAPIGDDITQEDFFTHQNQRIAVRIRDFVAGIKDAART